MKKLVITSVVAMVLSGWAGIGRAKVQRIEPTPAEAFVKITTTSNEVSLGTATFPGIHNLESVLMLKVESNCLHGSIFASTDGFRRPGGFIPPEHISVKAPVTSGFVSMEKPVAISETVFGSHDIQLKFRVQTGPQHHQGKYTGILILTLMPPI
ncbi:MAG: hypothetical protein ACYS9C_17630 [Planctomycetota bacterium]|jgi:hypothetical protein